MPLRVLIILLLLMGLSTLPSHEAEKRKEPWLELERGLKLCGVENILYQTSCFVAERDGDRVISSLGFEPLDSIMPPPACGWTMEPGYENGEILVRICGSDRQACADLWRRLERAVGRRAAGSSRNWSVEGCLSGGGDLLNLGTGLIRAIGGRLQGVYVNNRLVQMAAYLPWAGEGLFLEGGPVNALLELYSSASADSVKIRLGTPVLHSPAF